MNGTYLAYALGNNAFFASRVFLPAFIVALALRFPELAPFVKMDPIPPGDLWLVKDEVLVALGLFALFESWANKNPEVYEFFEQIDKFVKLGTALAINAAVLEPQIAQALFDATGSESRVNSLMIGAAVSTPVLFLTDFRKKIINFLKELDQDNDIGLLTLAQWLEDGWVFLGAIFLVLFPIVTFVLILIVLPGLFFFEKDPGFQGRKNESELRFLQGIDLSNSNRLPPLQSGRANDT
ncbi:hypothetical protein UR09_02610 [Candidatus Nitromaritima sp. SCGC AAA799-A02]|nr:hypothetical protein UR09_02610 [Candidatus Nitromaritima sp. SCGC AAA799-A02]